MSEKKYSVNENTDDHNYAVFSIDTWSIIWTDYKQDAQVCATLLNDYEDRQNEMLDLLFDCFQQFVIKKDDTYINDYMSTTEELGDYLVRAGLLQEVAGGWIKKEESNG